MMMMMMIDQINEELQLTCVGPSVLQHLLPAAEGFLAEVAFKGLFS